MRPGALLKNPLILFIHLGEIPHVDQKHRHLDDFLERGARGGEDRGQVREAEGGVVGHGARGKSAVGEGGELAGDVEGGGGEDGLGLLGGGISLGVGFFGRAGLERGRRKIAGDVK